VLIVNQYIAGEASVELPNGTVKIKLETNYPWDGKLKFTLESKPKPNVNDSFAVKFRIPSWSQTHGAGNNSTEIANADGYTKPVEITWGKPFVHTMELKMETKRIIAHPKVLADNGRVAIYAVK
jgi:DUF1680 family protein